MTLGLKADNVSQVENFCNNLQHILLGVSWGGHESLVFPACAGVDHPNFRDPGMNLVRLYCGLEDFELLKADISQALEKMN